MMNIEKRVDKLVGAIKKEFNITPSVDWFGDGITNTVYAQISMEINLLTGYNILIFIDVDEENDFYRLCTTSKKKFYEGNATYSNEKTRKTVKAVLNYIRSFI